MILLWDPCTTIRESFRGSGKFPSGYSDCLEPEENSPRRARSNEF